VFVFGKLPCSCPDEHISGVFVRADPTRGNFHVSRILETSK
jgi:hypothetical protein